MTENKRHGLVSPPGVMIAPGYFLRRMQQAYQAAWITYVDPVVTSPQMAVLQAANHHPGVEQGLVGASVALDRSTMAGIVNRLETRGWIVRKPSATDGRKRLLFITDEGRQAMTEVLRRSQALDRVLMSGYGTSGRKMIVGLFESLAEDWEQLVGPEDDGPPRQDLPIAPVKSIITDPELLSGPVPPTRGVGDTSDPVHYPAKGENCALRKSGRPATEVATRRRLNMKRSAAVLRAILDERSAALAPGIFDGLSAHLTAAAGFRVAYMSGAAVAVSATGMPDIGLTTQTEMVQQVALISELIDIPLVADADTGFGDVTHTYRTVRLYEQAGAAGIQLEDQAFPKRAFRYGSAGNAASVPWFFERILPLSAYLHSSEPHPLCPFSGDESPRFRLA